MKQKDWREKADILGEIDSLTGENWFEQLST
jgi:hypothetical protein